MTATVLFIAAAACALVALVKVLSKRRRYVTTWRRGGLPLYQRMHLAQTADDVRRYREAGLL